MATANGMHSFDSILFSAAFGAADPAGLADFVNWLEITDVISINGVQMERSVTQLTHLRSPDKAQEKVPGFLDAGQNTFRLNYFKGLVSLLETLSPRGALAPDTSPSWGRRKWAVVFPDRGVWLFYAFIKSKPFEIPEDNRSTVEVTLEISGKPVWFEFVLA